MSVIPRVVRCIACCCLLWMSDAEARPNVILIMTDDQGYGDIAAHGHPYLKTPHMDRLWRESVRLERFHVDPTCSPTRAALMTGRYPGRVGVWHTTSGRNLLRADEMTMGDLFRSAGYRTGVFGKWHLGDNYPYAARFRGFDDAVVHAGGGVGQTPDFWGNDYFEDHYNDNGTWRPFQGYCTDVWFREALRFIRESGDDPFFLYLPTNAAHQTRPHVPERYRALYDDVETNDNMRIFWGMISNIDDNLGVLLDRLEHWKLLENTILVFMGDNGTTMGPAFHPNSARESWSEKYNAGMRGFKTAHYDGGHRSFCFIHHPAGGLTGGRGVGRLTVHMDLLPTLAELCGIGLPEHVVTDGRSIVPLLRDPDDPDWAERTLVVENQRVHIPEKWRNTVVMTDRWRLVDNRELYDIDADPGQRVNVIDAHRDVAAGLAGFYDAWWDDVSRRHGEISPLYIGSEQQNPVQLNAHDWMPPREGNAPWNQPGVVNRIVGNGSWNVRVARNGRYAVTLRERPAVAEFPLRAETAMLQIGGGERLTRKVDEGATGVIFEVMLEQGDMEVRTWLEEAGGKIRGAYYVDVEQLAD